MKKLICSCALTIVSLPMWGQGNFTPLLDQQAAPQHDSGVFPMAGVGQSFTPTLNSIDFIRLAIFLNASDNPDHNAQVYLNLRSDAIGGPIIGTTSLSLMPYLTLPAEGFVSFSFPTPVALTPGQQYFFEPVDAMGLNLWIYASANYHYPDGALYSNGTVVPNGDLWFAEGIMVPEPSTTALLACAGTAVWFLRRR